MILARKRMMTAYAFLFFPLLFFILVRFMPMIYAMVMGTTNWGLLAKNLKFVGIDNFKKILGDEVFQKSFTNTLRYAFIGTPAVVIISLFIALHLNNITRGKSLFRLLYVLPYITPIVAVSWVWRWIYQPLPLGMLNGLFSAVGLPSMGFLNDPAQALYAITLVNVWVELGYCATIFLAGIQNVPIEFIEAAKIDGATERTLLFKITLPLLLPITLFLTVMEGIQFLRIFTQVYNMSIQAMGGPLDTTKSVALYIYQTAFTKFQMGVAASASLVLFAAIMVVTLTQMLFFDKKINY
ncbi:sugar ABC transporter permease [Treponema sp.]